MEKTKIVRSETEYKVKYGGCVISFEAKEARDRFVEEKKKEKELEIKAS